MADDGGIRVTLSSQAISGYGHRKPNHNFKLPGQAIAPVPLVTDSGKPSQSSGSPGHGHTGGQAQNTLRADTHKTMGRGTKINTVA
ncbi:MAG: hypothetical protein HQK57_03345 [Deltaproteobacteria bacterium]|nr:hypothetical protein [Deltaproteobacteria bacterium]